MYKTKTHILFFLTLISFSIGLVACKSKKPQGKKTNQSPNTNSANITEARFGYAYITACSERIKGNLQEALKLFEECKTLEPNNPAASYELATLYKLLGQNDKALINARFCAESDPKNEWYQLLLIDCYNSNKQYNQSVRVRESLVKNFPEKNDFKEDLAIEYAILGQYDRSYKIYDELEKNYGVSEQLTLNKVKLLKSQKKPKEAEQELKKLSDSNKNESRYYAFLAEFYLDQNELEKAKSMYDAILKVEPNNPMVNLALHDYYSAKGDEAQAFDYLKTALQNPDLDVRSKAEITGSFYNRAEAHSEKDLKQGLELSKIMLAVHPNSTESNAIYADFLRLDHKPKEAVLYYYLAATNEKRDFRVWENLLVVDEELNQYDSLEHHSAAAMELFPNQPANYLFNGVANIQLKNYSKATQSLNDGIEFVIDNKSSMLDFLRLLGDANFYLKDYPASDKAFDNALKIDSDNSYVLNNYAYYLSLRNENLDKAEKFSKRTNELKPNDRSYMDTYGWILYQQKKYKEAEDWLSKAAIRGPQNPTILEHYGDVLYRLNKNSEALMQWEAAKMSGGNSEGLLKKIKTKKLND